MKHNLISKQAELCSKETEVELSPLVFLCGKRVIFELRGFSIQPQQPLSLKLAGFLFGVL